MLEATRLASRVGVPGPGQQLCPKAALLGTGREKWRCSLPLKQHRLRAPQWARAGGRAHVAHVTNQFITGTPGRLRSSRIGGFDEEDSFQEINLLN